MAVNLAPADVLAVTNFVLSFLTGCLGLDLGLNCFSPREFFYLLEDINQYNEELFAALVKEKNFLIIVVTTFNIFNNLFLCVNFIVYISFGSFSLFHHNVSYRFIQVYTQQN